jgi:AraC-like DNA-binding protein
VARRSGFSSAAALRQHFRRLAGTSPAAYRTAFGPEQESPEPESPGPESPGPESTLS